MNYIEPSRKKAIYKRIYTIDRRRRRKKNDEDEDESVKWVYEFSSEICQYFNIHLHLLKNF